MINSKILFLTILSFIFIKCNSNKNKLSKLESEKIIAYSDTLKDETEDEILKFDPKIKFNNFLAKTVFKGTAKPLDFKSNKESKLFKTRITETYLKSKTNFAGHYCFVEWGCGSPCKMSVIVDLLTGKIYDGPSSSLGYEFQNNSRMLIVNPVNTLENDIFHPKPGYYLNCAYCVPEIYIWNENKKIFIKI